jgi:hypothetical protein
MTPKQPQQDTIRLVNYLEENDGPPQGGGGANITIDPNLQEQGAKIVAEKQNGRETFQGAWRPPGVAGFWPQQEYLADGGAKLPYATKLLGLNPYRAEKLWRQSARVTPRTLSRAAEICHAQDMAVKRGIIGDVSALQSVVSGI